LARIFGKGKKSNSLPKKEVEKIIQTARSFRGTPHKTGGMNRYGIDCSALMQVSFESAGIKIPRTAALQSQSGKDISKNDLKPGDLIFFSDKKIGKGITHVGLVTEITSNGEIKFIHTSSKIGVTENLLSTEYFSKTYAKSVRIF
jgi:cell wall-associated NlpC family hydrolase